MSSNTEEIKMIKNADLSKLSTLRVGGEADQLVEISDVADLQNFLSNNNSRDPLFVLGEGSNTLFTGDFKGTILLNKIKGIEIEREDDEYIYLRVGGGVNWHSFVEYCVDNNYAGIENLAYIPGTVGAAPVQNIAAYGQTQEDVFSELEAINLKSGAVEKFSKSQSEFAYRSSIFKKKYADQYFITHVVYKLKKIDEYTPDFSYHSRYESLQSVLSEKAQPPYSLRDIFNAVITIRQRKLPDWHDVGTCGSTFVNPFVNVKDLPALQEKFPNIQYYPVDKMQYPSLNDDVFKDAEFVKIPAGWLLEELGWKGKQKGNIKVSDNHALCVTVIGPATGKELTDFIADMKDSVKKATGIELQTEVNFV